MSTNKTCVTTLFARASKPGHVKKRLAVDVGDYPALEIHRFLVSKTLSALESLSPEDLQIWVDDICDISENDPLYPLRSRLIAQQGNSLGQRMANAVEYNIKAGRASIVIGSDCPLMSASYIQCAISMLQSDNDLVIGPAADGGYVLIGMTRFHKTLFQNITWGTATVLEQTLTAARKLGLNVNLLDVLWDVDRVEDLVPLTDLYLPGYPAALKNLGQVRVRAIV